MSIDSHERNSLLWIDCFDDIAFITVYKLIVDEQTKRLLPADAIGRLELGRQVGGQQRRGSTEGTSWLEQSQSLWDAFDSTGSKHVVLFLKLLD